MAMEALEAFRRAVKKVHEDRKLARKNAKKPK